MIAIPNLQLNLIVATGRTSMVVASDSDGAFTVNKASRICEIQSETRSFHDAIVT